MVAPLGESIHGELSTPAEREIPLEDLVCQAVQSHLQEGERLRNVEPLWRKDYIGDPSGKRYVGGALLLELTIFANDTFAKREMEVTDDMFEPETKAALDAKAGANWQAGHGWVRHIGRNKTT